jgi:two-component sensor histidine kinase
LFSISDNGIGLPDDFELGKSTTPGMLLMRGLSEQLNGTLDVLTENGVTIIMAFEPE